MKTQILFLFLVFSCSFALAQTPPYSNCEVYGNCQPVSTATTYTNNTYNNITQINSTTYADNWSSYNAISNVNMNNKNITNIASFQTQEIQTDLISSIVGLFDEIKQRTYGFIQFDNNILFANGYNYDIDANPTPTKLIFTAMDAYTPTGELYTDGENMFINLTGNGVNGNLSISNCLKYGDGSSQCTASSGGTYNSTYDTTSKDVTANRSAWINNLTNVALTNQSNTFTGNQTINGNLTATWFFGKLNWSNIQNIPSYVINWTSTITSMINTALTNYYNKGEVDTLITDINQSANGDDGMIQFAWGGKLFGSNRFKWILQNATSGGTGTAETIHFKLNENAGNTFVEDFSSNGYNGTLSTDTNVVSTSGVINSAFDLGQGGSSSCSGNMGLTGNINNIWLSETSYSGYGGTAFTSGDSYYYTIWGYKQSWNSTYIVSNYRTYGTGYIGTTGYQLDISWEEAVNEEIDGYIIEQVWNSNQQYMIIANPSITNFSDYGSSNSIGSWTSGANPYSSSTSQSCSSADYGQCTSYSSYGCSWSSIAGNNYVSVNGSIPETDLQGNFSIFAWVNDNQQSGQWWERAIACKDDGAGNKWILGVSGDGNSLVWHIQPNAVELTSDALGMSAGIWYHLGITRAGNNYTFYKNGVASGSSIDSTAIPTQTTDMWIGKCEGYFNTKIDDWRLYNTALSQTDIDTIYNSGSGTESSMGGGSPTITENDTLLLNATIIARSYNVMSEVFRLKNGRTALSFLKNSSQLLTKSGQVNHTAFEYSYEKITGGVTDTKGKFQKTDEETINLGKEVALTKQQLYDIASELCTKDKNKWSWCTTDGKIKQ